MPDIKISALPAASAALGADELAVNEAGTSKKLTVTQLQTFIAAEVVDARGGYATLGAKVRSGRFDVRDYGAVVDGVTNDTTAITAAMTAASAVGGTVYIPGSCKVTSLTMLDGVSLEGPKRSTGQPYGGILVGTAGSDILVWADGPAYVHATVRNLMLDGGRRGIAAMDSAIAHTYATIEDVDISGPSAECVYFEGHCEEWRFVRVRFNGGTHGFRFANVHALSGTTLLDKSSFIDCTWGGQTINNVRLEVQLANNNAFINPIFGGAGQDSVWINGGSRSLVFINSDSEGGGTTGKSNRTTLSGTVAAGATTGTLASATGWANGDTITIAGAATHGQDLTTTVTSLAGTAVGWTTATSTQVVGPAVTNAIYDDFHIETSVAAPSGTQFYGGSVGGEASGHLRYAIYNPGVDLSLNSVSGVSYVPVYDHLLSTTLLGVCTLVLRRPDIAAGGTRYGTLASVTTDTQQRVAIATSPAGGDYIVMLRDSTDNQAGTLGSFEVRKADANRAAIFKCSTAYGTFALENFSVYGTTSLQGTGFWNHAAPASQPAAPVTLADVIAIIRGCGLSA